MGSNSHADMDALSAKYAVRMQTSALNNQLYAGKSGLVVGKTVAHNVKNMPISLQNSASLLTPFQGERGVICMVTSLRAVRLCC